MYQVLRPTTTRPHVTSDAQTLHGRPGIVPHRVRSLDPALRTAVDGLPVTTLERVLLDLAEDRRGGQTLRRAWQEAQRLRLLDVKAVEALIDQSPGRRVRPLRALIAEATDAPDTREEYEHRFDDLMLAHPDIPRPSYNVVVAGYTVDAHWPGTGLVVELDSKNFHWHKREQDADRDADLLLGGYFTYHVTWRALTQEPDKVTHRIRTLLARHPMPAAGTPVPAP